MASNNKDELVNTITNIVKKVFDASTTANTSAVAAATITEEQIKTLFPSTRGNFHLKFNGSS